MHYCYFGICLSPPLPLCPTCSTGILSTCPHHTCVISLIIYKLSIILFTIVIIILLHHAALHLLGPVIVHGQGLLLHNWLDHRLDGGGHYTGCGVMGLRFYYWYNHFNIILLSSHRLGVDSRGWGSGALAFDSRGDVVLTRAGAVEITPWFSFWYSCVVFRFTCYIARICLSQP